MSWQRFSVKIIIAIIVLSIVSFVIMIPLHRHMYKYWSTKPVSWMTILPASRGIIDEKITGASFKMQSLPRGCRIVPFSLSQRGNAELVTRFLNSNSGAPYPRSPEHVRWALGYPGSRTYVLWENGQLAGMIHAARCQLDTPLHQELPCQFIDYLVVARDRRKRGRCTLLIDRVIRECTDAPAIGFFLSERRMPWAEIAAFSRYSMIINHTLLPESPLDVSIRIVTQPDQLPTKARECSRARVEGGATLEPTPDAQRWAHFVQNPYHDVLSVSGEDWIHLQWLPPHSETNNASADAIQKGEGVFEAEAEDEDEAEYNNMVRHAPAVFVRGFSMDAERVQPFLFAYLRARATEKIKTMGTADDDDLLHVIVSAPLQESLDVQGASLSAWRLYDAQFLYFYNYRLNKYNVHIPHTWNLIGE